MSTTNEVYFIGVDVGTGSARAALVNAKGKILRTAVKPIITWTSLPDFAEQSSDNIWNACCFVIKEVCKDINEDSVKGIGFDATCSLVALDQNGFPVTVSKTGEDERNVILWMDHRAVNEAKLINNTKHPILKYVGGKVSLEMQIPKLMWLKNHLKQSCWDRTDMFFDLPDFLTWKATGSESRSICSLVCKWMYEVNTTGLQGWNENFLNQIGMEDLLENACKKIGSVVHPPGFPCGNGLNKESAEKLGLKVGTPVGTSIIDAHAGGLGLIGCAYEGVSSDFHTKLGLICGTSTCHMAVSSNPIFVQGVWGPYYNAMVENMWLNEGGQSATGKLIDHIIDTHPATKIIIDKLDNNIHIQEYLNKLLIEMAAKNNLGDLAMLTNDLHMWPDFHGNRSPLADPELGGMVSGLNLSANEENLATMYLAAIQALAYGTKHILDTMKKSGYKDISSILICGGLSKNKLFVQTQADVVNLPVLCPDETESVLLGSAILGARAAGVFPNMHSAIKNMSGEARIIKPNVNVVKYHESKYKVFLKMVDHQKEYSEIMDTSS